MNTILRFLLGAALGCAATLSAAGQEYVAGKIYVAQINGKVTFKAGGRIVDLRKGDSQPAPGAEIETALGSELIVVYSNGTSALIDEKSALEIRKFSQRPFPGGVDTSVMEPSSSDTVVAISQGRVIIITNELATGTSMVYVTPHAQIRIRGKEVVIEVRDQDTRVTLVTGDATVSPLNAAAGAIGQVLRAGQTAIISNAAATTAAATGAIQVAALDPAALNSVSSRIAAAERAQKTVLFQTVNSAGGSSPEIQAKVVVPVDLPVPLTVSPSTLRTGG